MNGASVETDLISLFVNNSWVLLVTTIGVILVLYFDLGSRLYNYSKKPSLVFKPNMMHEAIEKKKGVFYTKVNFWISVINEGNKEAKNCHVFLKFTDEKFNENLVWKSSLPHYSVDEPFGVYWYFLNTKKDTVDIPVTNNSGYGFKIPFHMELLQTQNPQDWAFGDIMGWDDPVKELDFAKVDFPKQWELYEHVLGIVVEVRYGDNKIIKKNFLIKIPRNRKTEHFENDPWSIEFFEVKNE